jgi:hypothetical protein
LKVFALKMGAFVALFLVFAFLLGRWMDKGVATHYDLQYEEAIHPGVKANLIILGASHATHGINPKYLEGDQFRAYNLALNGGNPVFYREWYDKVLSRYYPRPSHVLYAADWFMFDDQRLARRFEQDSKYFPFRLFIEEMGNLGAFETLLLNRFTVIRDRKKVFSLLFKKKRYEDFYVLAKYYRGFVPYEARRDLHKAKAIRITHRPEQLEAFEGILDRFARDRIKVVLVQVPEYIPGRESPAIEENRERLTRIARERKLLFLDYNGEKASNINYEKALFSDWGHMNEKGAELFSRRLREDLEGLFRGTSGSEAPDKRQSLRIGP